MTEEHRTKEELEGIINKLASGEISDCRIRKVEITTVGEIIRKRNDFLHFNGTAQKGGDVIYKYLEEARS